MMDDGSSMMDHYNDDVCIDDSDVGFDMFCRCRLKSKRMMKKEEGRRKKEDEEEQNQKEGRRRTMKKMKNMKMKKQMKKHVMT